MADSQVQSVEPHGSDSIRRLTRLIISTPQDTEGQATVEWHSSEHQFSRSMIQNTIFQLISTVSQRNYSSF